MKRLRKEIQALNKEIRAMRRQLCVIESEMRRQRYAKLENIITTMQRSAREMLHLSRDL